jgi:hypothetical protein
MGTGGVDGGLLSVKSLGKLALICSLGLLSSPSLPLSAPTPSTTLSRMSLAESSEWLSPIYRSSAGCAPRAASTPGSRRPGNEVPHGVGSQSVPSKRRAGVWHVQAACAGAALDSGSWSARSSQLSLRRCSRSCHVPARRKALCIVGGL